MEHKNIVVRWGEGKKAHHKELQRLANGFAAISADIRACCGQSVSRLEWCGGDIHYHVGVCGSPYAGSNHSEYGNHEISLNTAVSYHWSIQISDLERRVAYLQTITIPQLRQWVEAKL